MTTLAAHRPWRWLHDALAFLINTSVWTSLSIVSLSVWAKLAVGGSLDPLEVASMFLFLFHAYTFDRLGDHPEDRGRQGEAFAPVAFISRHRRALIIACVAAAVFQVAIIASRPRLLLVILAVVFSSVFYMVPLPGVGKRLKEIAFFKSFYAPGIVTLSACLFFRIAPTGGQELAVMLAYFFHFFIDAALFDMKDMESDRRAGIRTLANHLGAPAFLAVMRAAALAGIVIFTLAIPYPWSMGAAVGFAGLGLATYLLQRAFSPAVLFLCVEGMTMVQLLVSLSCP